MFEHSEHVPHSTERTSQQLPQFVRERHYTVAEVAGILNIHGCTVRRLFEREPGVLKISNKKRGKRRWTMLRIPESVLTRVYQYLTQGGTPCRG